MAPFKLCGKNNGNEMMPAKDALQNLFVGHTFLRTPSLGGIRFAVPLASQTARDGFHWEQPFGFEKHIESSVELEEHFAGSAMMRHLAGLAGVDLDHPLVCVRQHGHVGEFAQHAFLRNDAQSACTALVTFPCHGVYTDAIFIPTRSIEFDVFPKSKLKAKRAGCNLLERLRQMSMPVPNGIVLLKSEMLFFDEGEGVGSSSMDVAACLRAILRAAKVSISPAALAEIMVQSEVASDPLVFERPVLFASREGRVVQHFKGAIPKMACLSFTLSRPIDTVVFVAGDEHRWNLCRAERAAELLASLRCAFRQNDLAILARAASLSARWNQEKLELPYFERLLAIASKRSLGLGISHSGSVCTFMWDAHEKSMSQVFLSIEDVRRETGVQNFLIHGLEGHLT